MFFFDENDNLVEAENATWSIIRECLADGTLIKEMYIRCNHNNT